MQRIGSPTTPTRHVACAWLLMGVGTFSCSLRFYRKGLGGGSMGMSEGDERGRGDVEGADVDAS